MVGGFHEVAHILHAGNAQLARLPGQSVQFLAGGTGVHLLELLVQLVHLLAGHPGVLGHLAQGFFHLGIFIDTLADGQRDTGQAGNDRGTHSGVAIEAVGQATHRRPLCADFGTHGTLGSGHLLRDAAVLLQGGVVLLRAGHGVLKLAAHLLLHGQQFLIGCAAEVVQHALGFLHLAAISLQRTVFVREFLLQLLATLFVVGLALIESGQLGFQFLHGGLDLGDACLGVAAVDVDAYAAVKVVCHILRVLDCFCQVNTLVAPS